jgi:hypothetical protein
MFGHKKVPELSAPITAEVHVPVSDVNVPLMVKDVGSPQLKEVIKELQDMKIREQKLLIKKEILEELLAVVTKERKTTYN